MSTDMNTSRSPAADALPPTAAPTAYLDAQGTLFIGRTLELDALGAMLARVRAAVLYGVAGVGKTSLALAFARTWPGPVVHHKVAPDEPLHVLVDDLRRQLAGGPVRQCDASEALDQLVRRLDQAAALCIVDDLHRSAPAARAELLGRLGGSLERGRLLCTSRERVPPPIEGPDRFDLRVENLPEESGRALWRALDVFYGSAGDFEAAFAQCHGHPLLLRRLHAGGGPSGDPIVGSLQALDARERRVVGVLAMTELRLPADVVGALAQGEPGGEPEGGEVLRRLAARLIVEIDAEGRCTLHDLYREAVLQSFPDREQQALHALACEAVERGERDPVIRTREVCRHLRAMGRFAEAGAYVLRRSAELVRHGAAGEILRAIDATPEAHRSVELQIARARVLGRLGDLRQAREDLALLVAAGAEPRVELKLALGQLSVLTLALDEAEAALRDVLASRDLRAYAWVRALGALATVETHRGRGAEALRAMRDAEARAGDVRLAAQLRLSQCYLLLLDGRHAEAEEPLRTVMARFRGSAEGFRAAVLAEICFAAVLSLRGYHDEAREALVAAEAAFRRGDDARTRVELRAIRGTVLAESGARLSGIDDLRAACDAFRRSGYRMALHWAEVLLARALFFIGSAREARRLLAQVKEACEARGARSLIAMAERAERDDPLALLDLAEGSPHAADVARVDPCRAEAFAAARAARAGDAERARALALSTAARAGQAPDRALERFLAALVLAAYPADAPVEVPGDDGLVAGGVDPELLVAVRERLAPEPPVAAAGAVVPGALAAGAVVPGALAPGIAAPSASFPIVFDPGSRRVHVDGAPLKLETRPVLRRLLRALAERSGEVVSRDDLVREVWGAEYHPLRHDNVLSVSVSRLRALLQPTRVRILSDDNGFRLGWSSTAAPPGPPELDG
ncbi:winged helix-turn-helix domain-containing protein [Sorangium sp. So ce1389]|uniref:winged helix-turn-helix domain-containing protein n=1 Tax=Sorangium sp. So ce1389 TaxID=3133336 RepID=UPI003F5E1A1E